MPQNDHCAIVVNFKVKCSGIFHLKPIDLLDFSSQNILLNITLFWTTYLSILELFASHVFIITVDFFFKRCMYVCMYLKELEGIHTHTHTQKEWEKQSTNFGLTSQIATVARVELAKDRSQEFHSGLPSGPGPLCRPLVRGLDWGWSSLGLNTCPFGFLVL